MTTAQQIVESLLETGDAEFVKDEVERLEPIHKIRISFSTVRFHDDESGDYDESNGWIDEEGVEMEPDDIDAEEGLGPVQLAIKYLLGEGATFASGSSFDPHGWYTTGQQESYTEPSSTEHNYHLVGFSPEEAEAVYNGVMKPKR